MRKVSQISAVLRLALSSSKRSRHTNVCRSYCTPPNPTPSGFTLSSHSLKFFLSYYWDLFLIRSTDELQQASGTREASTRSIPRESRFSLPKLVRTIGTFRERNGRLSCMKKIWFSNCFCIYVYSFFFLFLN